MRRDAKVVDVGGEGFFTVIVPTYMEGSYSVADRQQKRRQITMRAADEIKSPFLDFLAINVAFCRFS